MLFDRSFAPSMPPAYLLQHIGQLKGEQLPPVPQQHVTSKVILKQFGDPDRNGGQRLCAVSLERKRSKCLGPAAFGKIKNFVPVASGSIEQRWQAVETHFNDALRHVRSGSLFQASWCQGRSRRGPAA